LQKDAIKADNIKLANQANLYSKLPTLGSPSISGSANLWQDQVTDTYDSYSDYLKAGNNLSATIRPFSASYSYDIFNWAQHLKDEETDNSNQSSLYDNMSDYYSELSSIDSAFTAVLEAQDSVASNQASSDSAQRALAKYEVQYKAGTVAQYDYLNAQLTAEESSNTLETAQRNLYQAQQNLRQALALDTLPDLTPIDWTQYDTLLTKLSGLDDAGVEKLFNSLNTVYTAKNPAYLKNALSLKNSQLALSADKASYAPTVSLSVGIPSPTITLNNAIIQGTSDQKALGWSDLTIGLTVKLSGAWDIWSTQNTIDSEDNALKTAQLSYQKSNDDAADTLHTHIASLLKDAASLLSNEKSLNLAQLAYNIEQTKFDLGQVTASDLADDASKLLSAQSSLAASRYSFIADLGSLRVDCVFDDLPATISFLEAA
jgi:hypothetical protein